MPAAVPDTGWYTQTRGQTAEHGKNFLHHHQDFPIQRPRGRNETQTVFTMRLSPPDLSKLSGV